VQRALRHARRLGLVDWTERRIRAGWRWLRTSNCYLLSVPETSIDPSMRPIWWRRSTNGQRDGGGERLEKAKEGRHAVLRTMLREAAARPDLLAARRSAIEARLLTSAGCRTDHVIS
jgi:hypothetical protein